MPAARSHRDLIVWQKSMDLVVEIYRLSAKFPKQEMFRLTSQITGAAISVPGNIAEGNGRGTKRDYASFVSIAKGSLNEAETYFMVAQRLGYITKDEGDKAIELIAEISRMLTALRRGLLA